MEAQLQPACNRFSELNDEEQTAFRDSLGAFVNLYAFLSQIIPYADADLERLSAFGRALLPHLRQERGNAVHLGDDVELEYYRLQLVSSDALEVGKTDPAYVTSPTEVGTGNPNEDTAPLLEIIERLNDRFGTDFTDEDRLFFEQVKERAVRDEDVCRLALANPFDKFVLGVHTRIGQLMLQRMSENDALVTRYLDDAEFQQIASKELAREIFVAVGAG